MDLYSIFKFLHVVSSMAWVGGGVTLFALSLFAMMRNDEVEALRVVDSVGVLAMRWFVPAALLTLIFGVVVTTVGGLWAEAWVILGLVGFAATFVTGHFVLRPYANAIAAHKQAGRLGDAVAAGRAMMQISKFDYAMLFVVVALMVLKPSWNDVITLLVLAAILVVAAVAFLVMGGRRAALHASD